MSVNWMKQGAASKALAEEEKKQAEIRAATKGKMFRYWMAVGTEGSITFIDGDLSPEGYLLPVRFYEHNLYLSGKWGNHFVCPQHTNPESGQKCPICESGDRPDLVALFTVIDHRLSKSKDGTKTYQNQRRLFVVKQGTYELLNKIAIKRNGLAGATFDVARMTDKEPNVGSMFDFTVKTDIEELKKKYTEVQKGKDGKDVVVTIFEPANYEEEIVYRTETELRAAGFGPSVVGGTASSAQQAPKKDYEEHL